MVSNNEFLLALVGNELCWLGRFKFCQKGDFFARGRESGMPAGEEEEEEETERGEGGSGSFSPNVGGCFWPMREECLFRANILYIYIWYYSSPSVLVAI